MQSYGVQLIPRLRFDSDDVAAAHEAWGCNCGPAALAAATAMTLDEVRPYLGDFEKRGYMNPTMMGAAVTLAGFKFQSVPRDSGWPSHGLVRIQFGGPWTLPGANPRWASTHTHWVASKLVETKRPLPSFNGLWVFDVNAGWLELDAWVKDVVPLLAESIKRADGTWKPTHSWEVRRVNLSSLVNTSRRTS